MPDSVRSIATLSDVTWVRVNGEPVGVQAAPITLPVQLPSVPNPGAIFVKLKKTVPAVTVNVPKSATDIAPVRGGPVSVLRLTADNPENVPVLGDEGAMRVEKSTAVGVTVTLPVKLA